MSLSIRLHLISCLFQGTAVYQSKAPAQRHTQIHKHTLKTLCSNENVNSAMEKKTKKGLVFFPLSVRASETGAFQTERRIRIQTLTTKLY